MALLEVGHEGANSTMCVLSELSVSVATHQRLYLVYSFLH